MLAIVSVKILRYDCALLVVANKAHKLVACFELLHTELAFKLRAFHEL